MKAIACKRYGPPEVLEFIELPKPIPADDEILIRVRATTVSSGDWRVRSLTLPRGFGPLGRLALGMRGPRQPILGTELAGDVESVGRAVTSFKVADAVFAFPGGRMGAYAEYMCMRADGPVAKKPSKLSYEQAAALSFGAATMLDFFRRGELRSGERVLVNGAAGAVGTAAIQLAKHAGAHVTAVCSDAKFELVRSIGADAVVDYRVDDFSRSGKRYDVIVDAAGTAPFSRSRACLSNGGRLLLVLADLPSLLLAPWHTLTSDMRVVAGPAEERPAYLHQIAELVEARRFMPVIDRAFPFEAMVAAHRYVDQGRKSGNVVVTLGAATGAL